MPEPCLCRGIAGLSRPLIPVRRGHGVLLHLESLRVQALQQRFAAAWSLCGSRSAEPGQVNLAETRHRGHRALLGGALLPTDGFDEILQHALAALVEARQSHLCIAHAAFRERAQQHGGRRLSASRKQLLGALERGLGVAALETRQEGSDAHTTVCPVPTPARRPQFTNPCAGRTQNISL
jgi:hypothetical protein